MKLIQKMTVPVFGVCSMCDFTVILGKVNKITGKGSSRNIPKGFREMQKHFKEKHPKK